MAEFELGKGVNDAGAAHHLASHLHELQMLLDLPARRSLQLLAFLTAESELEERIDSVEQFLAHLERDYS